MGSRNSKRLRLLPLEADRCRDRKITAWWRQCVCTRGSHASIPLGQDGQITRRRQATGLGQSFGVLVKLVFFMPRAPWPRSFIS